MRTMRARLGFTLIEVLIALAMLGLKLTPSYIEYFAIKKAVNALAQESRGGASVARLHQPPGARRPRLARTPRGAAQEQSGAKRAVKWRSARGCSTMR